MRGELIPLDIPGVGTIWVSTCPICERQFTLDDVVWVNVHGAYDTDTGEISVDQIVHHGFDCLAES